MQTIDISHNNFKIFKTFSLGNEVKKYIYHILVIQLVLLVCFPSNYFALGIGIMINILYLVYLHFVNT